MSTPLTLHIYARAAKANAADLQPLYVRITIEGKRTEFSTRKFIDPKKWDAAQMKMKGNTEEARAINSYLETMKSKITHTQVMLQYQGTPVTLKSFMNAYKGEKQVRERTLIPIFQEHNKRVKSLIGIDFAEGTYERYETTLRHLQEFIVYQYHSKDTSLNKIDHTFITDFDFFLRTNRACSNNTTVKYIKNFKKIIRICLANNWIERDPFLSYKAKLQPVERNFLTQEELGAIKNKDIKIERLDLVRDIFVFSCYTGLAYIDVRKLTPDHLVKGMDGQLWIHTHRQKTDIASKIPLLEPALKIIEKYRDHPKAHNEGTLLPILTNQKMNAYLKEIADISGVSKHLTFHCARHTFATTVTLSNGVPIETVSKMLGHTSIKTTQHYARITDKKVGNDMENLKQYLSRTEEKTKKKQKKRYS